MSYRIRTGSVYEAAQTAFVRGAPADPGECAKVLRTGSGGIGRDAGDAGDGETPGGTVTRSLLAATVVVLALHVAGFGLLWWVVDRATVGLGGGTAFGLGLGITAYTLGMRHAFDADHIAAIDNTTRKLVTDGRRPVTVGFWFSLGHSTVVFGLCVLLAAGVRTIMVQVDDSASLLQRTAGVIGTTVSGVFLLLIGVLNLIVLVRIVGIFRRMRGGHADEAELEQQLNHRGGMLRLIGRVLRVVRRPWHMYPVGLLFGLGFDTATEISLLVMAGSAAVVQLPWYAILTLPILFTAGMSLLDTMDGAFMNVAYGWAAERPVRRVYYNMTVTGISVAVALVIGGAELLGLLADQLGVRHGPLAWAAGLDMNFVGYGIVVLFLVTWLAAVAVWKLGGVERRWSQSSAGG